MSHKGPDPLPDEWGDWLVQNAKGRVRVLGGLEAQEHSGPFLGSLSGRSAENSAESVGTPPRSEFHDRQTIFGIKASKV